MKKDRMMVFGTITAVASLITGIISIRKSAATGSRLKRVSGILDLVTAAAYLGIILLDKGRQKS